MKGKVFAESQNLYQDQAKVLFDYYQAAAEKIVSQEETIEKKIAELKERQLTIGVEKKQQQTHMIISGVAGVVAGVIFIFLFGVWAVIVGLAGGAFFASKAYKKFSASKQWEEQSYQQLKAFQQNFDAIFRDYKVEKLGVVYVPVATQVPFENRSFYIDHTGSFGEKQFELQLVNDQKTLNEKMSELDALSTSAPLVEKSEEMEEVDTDNYSRSIQKVKFYDYFGRLDRNLRTSAYCLSDVRTASVSMPVIPPDADRLKFFDEFATTDPGESPVISVFDVHRYDKAIDQFKTLNEIRRALAQQNEQFEDVLRRLISNVGYAVQTIATLKVASSHKLVQRSNELLFTILKASYNHYSPLLEKEELDKMRQTDFNYSDSVDKYTPFQLKESSRMKYELSQGKWVGEDGSWSLTPFGISQIQEEIVAPVVQNLMAETRLERLRYYNDIKNQKINYLNQWHQDTEDFYGRNRTSSDDLINIMRSNLTKFLAAQATLNNLESMKKQMKSQSMITDDETNVDQKMVEDLAAFEIQAQGFKNAQDEFEAHMDRMKEDIGQSAKRFGYIEYYDATLRDRMAKDLVDAGDSVSELDERRRPLASINPLYAKISVIPPQPSVEDCVDEHFAVNVATMATLSLKDIDATNGAPWQSTATSEPYDEEEEETEERIVIEEEEVADSEAETLDEEDEEVVQEEESAEEESEEEESEDEESEMEEEEPEEEVSEEEIVEIEEDDLDDLEDFDDLEDETETPKK